MRLEGRADRDVAARRRRPFVALQRCERSDDALARAFRTATRANRVARRREVQRVRATDAARRSREPTATPRRESKARDAWLRALVRIGRRSLEVRAHDPRARAPGTRAGTARHCRSPRSAALPPGQPDLRHPGLEAGHSRSYAGLRGAARARRAGEVP